MPRPRTELQTSSVGHCSNAAAQSTDGRRSHSTIEVRRSFLILLLIRIALWAAATEFDFHDVHHYGIVLALFIAWLRLDPGLSLRQSNFQIEPSSRAMPSTSVPSWGIGREMPNRLILARSVVRFSPSLMAAPRGPPTIQ